MVMKWKKTILTLFSIFFFAFLLNYFWESLHGFSLYENQHIDSGEYVLMINYMSVMDALTIVGIFWVVCIFVKDIFWLEHFHKKGIMWMLFWGLVVGAVAEYKAVYFTHDWHYNQYMPVILGVGLSPLIQLSITGWVSIWLTKKMIYP